MVTYTPPRPGYDDMVASYVTCYVSNCTRRSESGLCRGAAGRTLFWREKKIVRTVILPDEPRRPPLIPKAPLQQGAPRQHHHPDEQA